MKMLRSSLLTLMLLAAPLMPVSAAQGDLKTELTSLASSGNAEALYHLGMLHHLGMGGVAKDPAKALDFFRQAAAGGDPLGAYKLGCYYDGQGAGVVDDDPELALKHKLIAAKAGYALAQHDTALLYYKKGAVAEALEWLKAAADQGDAGSLMAYASVHNGGEGIAKNPVTTLAYFTLALKARGEPVSERQTQWRNDFRSKMSPAEIKEAEKIIAAWKPQPTALTVKALSGDRAAEALIREAR